MFTIQVLDHEEGTGALWVDLKDHDRYESREAARGGLRAFRASEDDGCLCSYRIVEAGSELYYSQPTDAQEY